MFVVQIPAFDLEAAKDGINQGSVTSPFIDNLDNDIVCTFADNLCEVVMLGVKMSFATYYIGSAYHLIHGEPKAKIAVGFQDCVGKKVTMSAYCQEVTLEASIVEATYFKVISESKFVISIIDTSTGYQQHLMVNIDKDEVAVSILNP